jgi:hypothetical protein
MYDKNKKKGGWGLRADRLAGEKSFMTNAKQTCELGKLERHFERGFSTNTN